MMFRKYVFAIFDPILRSENSEIWINKNLSFILTFIKAIRMIRICINWWWQLYSRLAGE